MKRKGVTTARRLRRDATDAETALWLRLRDRRLGGFKFRRQEPRAGFVVDFVCLERKLVIEVDGGQHAERAAADEGRSIRLRDDGFRVLRFWNNEVLGNMEGVLETILAELGGDPSPHPSPAGRGSHMLQRPTSSSVAARAALEKHGAVAMRDSLSPKGEG